MKQNQRNFDDIVIFYLRIIVPIIAGMLNNIGLLIAALTFHTIVTWLPKRKTTQE